MKINVKIENIDDELLFKRLKLRVGGKEITTPVKTGYKLVQTPINEIFKKFDDQKIDKCLKDERFERAVNSDIKRDSINGVNFFFVDYASNKIPTQKQIEFLSDIQYEHSDVVITSILSKLTRELTEEKLLNTFMDVTNKYIEIAETLNNKSIIGIVPRAMPRQFLEPIIKNYHNKGVTSFIVDSDGKSIDSNPSWIRNLIRLLKDYGVFDESFLYCINSYEGRFMKNANEILAKDFISTGFGIDILGINHLPPRMPSEAWAKIKAMRRENTYRLFNRATYGYVKKTEAELRSMNIRKREELKRFNIIEQHKETQVLQQKLKEEDTVENYIKNKKQVTGDLIKKIKNLRKKVLRR